MAQSYSVEHLPWWQLPQPTPEELHFSGGLYVEDWPHARYVTYLSQRLFEATQPLHELDGHALRLLERGAFLHNTGMMVEVRRHHKHSYRLISETKLPDFNDEERHEIACIARYHRRALPNNSHEEFATLSRKARKRVSILSALVRIADALDYSHDGRVLFEVLSDDAHVLVRAGRRHGQPDAHRLAGRHPVDGGLVREHERARRPVLGGRRRIGRKGQRGGEGG